MPGKPEGESMTDPTLAGEAINTNNAESKSIQERAREARSIYEEEERLYESLAKSIEDFLRDKIKTERIQFHEVTSRAKDPESFERKAAQRSASYPMRPKYLDPLAQITDKAAVRVITYFLEDVYAVCAVIDSELDIVEKHDRIHTDPDRPGYRSVHYLVAWPEGSCAISQHPEY